MTLYLARHRHLVLNLGTGKTEPIEDEWGNRRLAETRASLTCRFDASALTSRCMDVADQLWFSSENGGPPCLPSPENGLFRHIVTNDDGTAMWGGETFVHGAKKQSYLSAYDSADPANYVPLTRRDGHVLSQEEFTAHVDSLLQSHANFGPGRDFVMVEAVKVPLPWKTYSEIKGASGVKQIKDTIVNVTRDPDAVIAYEHQRKDGGRTMYIQAAEDARQEMEEQQAEASALEVSA